MGVADDAQIADGVEGHGIDEVHHAPEVLVVHHIGLAVGGVVEVEGQLAGALGADVLGDLVDVVHQGDGVTESLGIDILNQVRLGLTVGFDEFDSVGMIDIAGLNGLVADILALDAELAADLFKLLIQIHRIYPLVKKRY